MKRAVQILLLAFGVLIVARGFSPERAQGEFDVDGFAALPVQDGGRIKPLDTVARTTLLMLRGKQTVPDPEGAIVSATEWLADLALDRERGAGYPVFRVDDPGVLGLLHSRGDAVRHFSYRELRPFLEEIERQFGGVPEEAALRNRYERALVRLRTGIAIHQNLAHSFYPPVPATGNPLSEYERFSAALPAGLPALEDRETGGDYDAGALDRFLRAAEVYRDLSESARLPVVPPRSPGGEWENIGTAVLSGMREGALDPVVLGYARLADARQKGDAERFNRELAVLAGEIAARRGPGSARVGFETFFNRFQPFGIGMTLYVLVFLVAAFSWAVWPRVLADTAFYLTFLAFAVHSFGLASRVYLSGYAPVTNLYSSAVFVGWAAVLLGILLERFYRIGIGSAVAAAVGFCTLLLAHHLSMDGDTLEMMQAVLDSNFWLSTHVVTITIGYSAVFLAGFLGALYVFRAVLTPGLDAGSERILHRMGYGVLCFALLFSFAGTVLGGIWADQSWGRFWGWDPKENGALLIVLWLALVLHAKRGGLVAGRGLMLLAVGGNIVASWSWFGTNMLGVGLHSYGFMDRAFFWLLLFWASQIAVILLGATPRRLWLSGKEPKTGIRRSAAGDGRGAGR